MSPPVTIISHPSSPLTGVQTRYLNKVQKFLVNVADPRLAAKVAMHGYTKDEHAEGWSLFMLAAGANRPFDLCMSDVAIQQSLAQTSPLIGLYCVLDSFENKWFPRARTAIRRFVPADFRPAVETAFFQDMAQQPLGPTVVGSVERFLNRFEDLSESSVSGVKAVKESLQKKGLTDALVTQTRGLIAQAKNKVDLPVAVPADLPQLQAEARDQLAAYEQLKAWYQDWAGTLRDELTYHESARLGIITVRGNRANATSPDDDVEPANVPAEGDATAVPKAS